jgi:DNA-binding SARP family transcriptional activator
MHLKTLGMAELRSDSSSGTVVGAGKPLAVLIYLSAAPARTASRHTITSLLWADIEADAARHNLRQALWYLRRKAGREIVTTNGDALQLVPDVRCDRDELLDAASAGNNERVVELYAGPFVPDFAAPGGSGFEDWCALERRRLLETFRHSAEAVIRSRLAQGHARDAVALTRKLRDQDIYTESSWRLLLEVSASTGDLLSTRAEAEALRTLAEQHDLELEPATQAALRRATAQPSTADSVTEAPDRVAPLSATLVGREAAFSTLLAAWDVARTSRMARVHVTARPGIGKSRLLRDFAARLRAMRARIIAITGSLGTRDVPYGVASDLAAGLAALPGRRGLSPHSAATLVDLNPTLSTWFDVPARAQTTSDALRSRTIALRELAVAVSSEHPVAVLIDDLHWCDEESEALLTAFADGLRDARILVVTTGRPEARRSPLVAHDATQQVTLEPLSATQVEELLLSIASLPLADWAQDFAADLWRASRGSPLLALELLQLLEDRELLQRVDGMWQTGRGDLLLAELRAGDVLRARLEGMDRFDRWILTLLAVAGTPLASGTVIEASERPERAVRERLRSLEARGLAVAEGETWSTAHDEIAEELLRLTNAEGASRAAARVGRALLSTPHHDETTARRAAQLLRQTDDRTARGDLLRRFARQRFELGDRRTVRALALDLFGATTDRAQITDAVAAAPWSWRLGLVSPLRRMVMGGGVALLATVTAIRLMLLPPAPPPDAELVLMVRDTAGRVSAQRVELREGDWEPQRPLIARAWEAITGFTLKTPSGFTAAWHQQRSELITSQAVDDDGAMELFVHDGARAPHRIVQAPGDDQDAAISPDGRLMAFFTARWDSLSRYDIALLSLADSNIRQLTSGSATDVAPRWAPDGDRLAFSRYNWGRGPNELCVVEVRSTTVQCAPAATGSAFNPVAWIDADRIVLLHQAGPFKRLRVMQWSSRELTTVAELNGLASVAVSEDSRWVFCICSSAGGTSKRPTVFPLAAPRLAREIAPTDTIQHIIAAVFTSSRAGLEVASVRIDNGGLQAVPAGVPVQLSASVEDAHQRLIAHHAPVRWSVSDTVAGRIDSLGVLVATGRTPRVVVTASAALARDSVVVAVNHDAPRLRLSESWDDLAMPQWFPWGRPVPVVTRASDGRAAFLNNGEGSFESGVASRTTFDASAGLAVDAEVAATVARPQWQKVNVAITQGMDRHRFEGGAGLNVSPTPSAQEYLCGIGYPLERVAGGDPDAGSISTSASTLEFRLPDSTWLRGTWHRVRLQLFPDGRCGFALDDVPHSVVRSGSRIRTPARVLLAGNSAGTRILVGKVRVTEGVPRDIDWTQARTVP